MFKRKPKPQASGKPQPKPRQARPRKTRLSWTLAAAVVALQAGILASLAVATRWQPPKVRVIEAGWVWMQDASFYLMVLLLIGGPALTWMACSMDRKKRGVLTLSWAAFGLTLVLAFGAEAQAMLQTVWAQVPVVNHG